jgi:hypothetical protein
MKSSPAKRARRLVLAPLLALGFLVPASAASAAVVYDNVPSTLPGNVISQAFQATQTSEFGGQIRLAGTERQDPSVTVTMSSWACESRPAPDNICTTTPGATFSHPITLNMYSVLPSGQPGGQIASVTQTFDIPFRPSTSAICGANPTSSTDDPRWSQDGTAATCFNGFANNITFDLTGRGISLPDRVIPALAYQTSNYGKPAIGPQPCGSTPQGCPYDSLNVGLAGAPTVGTLPRPDDAYLDSVTPGQYCDGGTGGTDTLRLDAGCRTDEQPMFEVDTVETTGTQGPPGATGPQGPSGGVGGVVGGSKKKKCKKSAVKKSAAKKCKKKKK